MTGEIVLNERGIKLCRELIAKACGSKESCKEVAKVMDFLGYKTIEDVLILLFAKDAFNKENPD